MHFDLMVGATTWKQAAETAQSVAGAGFSGMLFTETSQTPWMSIAAAATAAPGLDFSTGIAVAFPRSPMVSAALAWELAENTGGRFRLGLGSQVKAHIERRYGTAFDPVGPRMRDYVLATKACLRAFGGSERLAYDGKFYKLSLLPAAWSPRRHDHTDVKVDISAVGPWMCTMAGEVADGIHVHPFHSLAYLQDRLQPSVAAGAAKVGRNPADIDLIIPVFAVAGDTPEDRAQALNRAKSQIAFYGSTKNYAFQFDDLGFEGVSSRLNDLMKAGDIPGMSDLITDEMADHYAVIAPWDEMADKLVTRYRGTASRIVSYLTAEGLQRDPSSIGKWGEVARAVRAAT